MFSELRKGAYRALKYRLLRPTPPPLLRKFRGPVVVVGSAPVSHKPEGFDETFTVITVNGSQFVTSEWGIPDPDITMMMFNQVEGTTRNAMEVRRVLSSRRTGSLYVFLWRKRDRQRLERGLRAFDYGYEDLHIVDRYERMALLDKVAGQHSLELDADSKVSTGVNAVLFALYHKAPAVVITGINPMSAGHAYNDAGLGRLHQQVDHSILQRLQAQGAPIYTSDPMVAENTGIRYWRGVGGDTQ